MRKGFLWAMALLIAAANPLWAQIPFNRLPPEGCEPDHHVWGRLDYLYWGLKSAPLPVPLAATSPTNFGTLATGDATVLYGQGSQSFPGFNGGRILGGFWIDPEGALGFEASGFLTQRRSAGFSFASDATGNPYTFVPSFNPSTNAENTFVISVPDPLLGLPFTGNLNINNSMQLWGYNADFLLTTIRSSAWEVSMIGGFRYLDLMEEFNLTANSTNPSLFSVSATDNFQTRNQFYGGEIGVRARLQCPVVFLEMAGKVAFGVNHQQANIFGQTTTDTTPLGGGVTVTPGGIFAQPSNGGNHTQTVLAVVPEAQVRVGVNLSSHLKLSAGYDFVFLSGALRPGNQIDRVVDPTQTVARPAFNFNTSEFWAHGVSLGLELRY